MNGIHEIHKQIVRQRTHGFGIFHPQQNSLGLAFANENRQMPVPIQLLQNQNRSRTLKLTVNNSENNKFTAICHDIFFLCAKVGKIND
jgi:hypothetical protein